MRPQPMESRNPDARMMRADPAPVVAEKTPSVWRGRIAFIAFDPANAPLEYVHPICLNAGITMLVVQAADGARRVNDRALADYVPRAKRLGYKVALWQWGVGDDPAIEGMVLAGACRELGADAAMLNGEKPYEPDGKLRAWIDGFDAAFGLGRFPLAWSPEGRQGGDHEYAQARGVAYCPQAYPNIGAPDTPGVIEFGAQHGWTLDQMIPLLGIWGDTHWEPTRYAIDTAGCAGACVYYIDGALNREEEIVRSLAGVSM